MPPVHCGLAAVAGPRFEHGLPACVRQTLEVDLEQSGVRAAGLAAALERESQARVVAEADAAMTKRQLIRMPSECYMLPCAVGWGAH